MSAKPAAKVIPFSRRAKRGHQLARQSALSKLDNRVAQLEALIAELDRRTPRTGLDRRFHYTLAGSALLHVLLITLVTFTLPKAPEPKTSTMDVVLVNARSKAPPPKAAALSQHNLDGGGNTDAERRARSPLPALRDDPRMSEVAIAQKRVIELEEQVQSVLRTTRAAKFAAPAQPNKARDRETPQPEAPPSLTPAEKQQHMNIQRLEAELARQMEAYQKRPRRHSLGASTTEVRYARYVENWRVKVMNLAEENYPQAARDNRIYGSLLLTVSIRKNGSIEGIKIVRPSGHKVLDEAAVRIVRMGAPYAPFPPEVARDTDVLDISRTWRFTSSDKIETD
jgi:protein TonB